MPRIEAFINRFLHILTLCPACLLCVPSRKGLKGFRESQHLLLWVSRDHRDYPQFFIFFSRASAYKMKVKGDTVIISGSRGQYSQVREKSNFFEVRYESVPLDYYCLKNCISISRQPRSLKLHLLLKKKVSYQNKSRYQTLLSP